MSRPVDYRGSVEDERDQEVDRRIARLERLLLLVTKAMLGQGGMQNETLTDVQKELESRK